MSTNINTFEESCEKSVNTKNLTSKKYKLEDLLAMSKGNSPLPEDLNIWEQTPPVGQEII